MSVLSVPGRRDVRLLLLSVQHYLPSPALQTGPLHVVEVGDDQNFFWYSQGFSPLLGVSDHDHLRGEVRVRFSAPPSDVVDQNPHDGCHHLHRHSHDSYHLSDVSSQGTMCMCFVVALSQFVSGLILFQLDLGASKVVPISVILALII